jgi:hypothetical protein
MGQVGRSCTSIGRFSGRTLCDSFSDKGFLYPIHESVAGFLMLVDLCKVLIADP